MSPVMRLCCIVALSFALITTEVSAARRLHMRTGTASVVTRTVFKVGHANNFARKLSSVCANNCSDILGTATNFGVLAGTAVTSSGATSVVGDVGSYPGTSIIGFPPGIATGLIRRGDSTATKAQTDAHIGYAYLQGLTYNTALSGTDLVGLTLTPGVYYFSSGAQLSGDMTLDALGDSSALFVFQTTTTFVTAAVSHVLLVNNAQPCNVYYQVGTSATLGAYSVLQGNMVADQQVALSHNTTVVGSLIALGAAVTMDTNGVTSQGDCSAAAPPPSTPPPATPPPPTPPPASTSSPSPSNGTLVGGVLQTVQDILKSLG